MWCYLVGPWARATQRVVPVVVRCVVSWGPPGAVETWSHRCRWRVPWPGCHRLTGRQQGCAPEARGFPPACVAAGAGIPHTGDRAAHGQNRHGFGASGCALVRMWGALWGVVSRRPENAQHVMVAWLMGPRVWCVQCSSLAAIQARYPPHRAPLPYADGQGVCVRAQGGVEPPRGGAARGKEPLCGVPRGSSSVQISTKQI